MASVYFSVEREMLMTQEAPVKRRAGRHSLVIGLPAEADPNERRVALTPETVGNLVWRGHQVLVEDGAGAGCGYSNLQYSEMGAYMVDPSQVYQADVILKINPPQADEIRLMRPKQTLFSFLPWYRLNSDDLREMAALKTTAINFDRVRDGGGAYPIMRMMSEIAGTVAVQTASRYMSLAGNGKGVLLGGVSGVPPTEVVIVGAGTAAEFAARAALGAGALVRVFDYSVSRLQRLQCLLGQRLYTSALHPQTLSKALAKADAVVLAARADDRYSDDYLLSEEMVMGMKQGAVIIDLSIAQWQCCASSQLCSLMDPIVIRHKVVHYCVPNITANVPRTASMAISNVMATLLDNLSAQGSAAGWLQGDAGVRGGVYLFNGVLTDAATGELLNLPHQDINLLMTGF
jgi:alanine dehydrogenase